MTGAFISPWGVAMYDELCFVADYGNGRIQVFKLDGTFMRQWTTGDDSAPTSVAVNEKGEVFVCDRSNDCISVFALDGTFLREWDLESESMGTNYGIAVNSTGDIYVAKCGDGCIGMYRQDDGTVVRHWGEFGDGEGQFQGPVGVAVHGDEVLVCDTDRIKVFALNGAFLRQWGSRGGEAGQLNIPKGLAVTKGGEVIVCDNGNDRVQIYGLDGSFLRQWNVTQAVGVAVSGHKVVVCNVTDHAVQVFV
jgi:DNA-binding beta-propeller fold protein YncE